MHRKATWTINGKGLLCAAVAAMLPVAVAAQSQQPQNQQPPQARLPVGFPGFHAQSSYGHPNVQTAKPSAAVPAQPAPVVPAAVPAPVAVPASSLPATPVTQTAITAPAAPGTPATPLLPGQRPAHRATVTYENGKLTVNAHNSSLNQILRAIMRETGLQVDGGVEDSRVYGVYGPTSPSRLFSTLLAGTGSDVLYIAGSGDQPPTLTLTARKGKTPPGPSASAADDLLPDGPGDDPPQSAASLAVMNKADIPTQEVRVAPVMPPGFYPTQDEGPHQKVTSLPPPTVDKIYQQIKQLHDAQIKLAQDQKAGVKYAQPVSTDVPLPPQTSPRIPLPPGAAPALPVQSTAPAATPAPKKPVAVE